MRNRKIGFVFQSYNLIPRTSARRQRRAAADVRGTEAGGATAASRCSRSRPSASSDRVDHLPSELSGGQQQRVAVARALATDPAMILADEPTGNLDSESSREVLEIFSRLNDRGRTIVLITHEDDVAAYAKRVVRLRDGVVVSDTAVPEAVPA